MASSPYDDLDHLGKEIDRLWSKVGASSQYDMDPPLPPAPVDAQPSRQLAWETVAMLKRQHGKESSSWRELMESREQALSALRNRLAAVEAENLALRERQRGDDERLMEHGLQTQAQLEAAMQTIEAERRAREQEVGALRGLLDQTRQRFSSEDARAQAERREWDKKEQQYLLDMRELQNLAARHQEEASRASGDTRRLSDAMREAKGALEKTLSELLRERQVREASEKEHEQALKKVDAAEKHLDELSKIWDEERSQWRELWDRERATWEGQRQEMSSWEQRLREERQKWHADLEAKEKDQLRFTDEMTHALRETAELSDRVNNALRPAVAPLPRRRTPASTYVAAAAVLLLAVAAPFAYKHYTALRLTPVASQALSLANPSAVAYDGALVWFASWDGRFVAYDPANLEASVRSAAPTELAPFRPAALAFGGEFLWTLDAAQARVIRHRASDPAKVLAMRPSPGPAPTALAYDGRSLWSYDAANRSLYRHGNDEGTTKAFSLGVDIVVTAMTWIDGKLWTYDAKSRKLFVFSFEDETLKLSTSVPFDEPVLALFGAAVPVEGKRRAQLWALAGPGGARQAPALLRYDY